jgi:hypothetical protein
MINVRYPPNILMLYEMLIPIFTFDILNSDWTTGLVMKFDDEHQTENQKLLKVK